MQFSGLNKIHSQLTA